MLVTVRELRPLLGVSIQFINQLSDTKPIPEGNVSSFVKMVSVSKEEEKIRVWRENSNPSMDFKSYFLNSSGLGNGTLNVV